MKSFIKTYVKHNLGYKPIVFLWCEKVSKKEKGLTPCFYFNESFISETDFYFYHEQYSKKEFVFRYQIYKEQKLEYVEEGVVNETKHIWQERVVMGKGKKTTMIIAECDKCGEVKHIIGEEQVEKFRKEK